jgi:hypothetical protein
MSKGEKLEKLYPVYLTKDELLAFEEALWDKSTLLDVIAHDLLEKKEKGKAHKAKERSVYFERLAGKVGLPLDEIYKAEYATTTDNKTTKETA